MICSWPRTLGQMLNESYPQGAASLNLGLQPFLPRCRDYLIHKVNWGLILIRSSPENYVDQLQLSHFLSIGQLVNQQGTLP
ncbi:hypothetical protein DPMN_003345 [Dreissena polymorpha]|uniref:Uncharacterized protein n=1 Tax=Dreissena polymorpha TaxID=45954 RepID=A0A9D4MKS3_DREPO|nr:hypothetical protein DPMN_003345 [Dreissena polymorpha]